MAEDISKKISIDVQINNDGQDQINQYKVAFDSLRNSISNLSNPLFGLSNNISSLDKDISKFTSSVNKLSLQNKELGSSTDKVKESAKDLPDIFKAWREALKAAEIESKLLMNSLSAGIAILVVFGPEILKWVASLLKGKEAIDKAKLSLNTLNSALESSDYSNAIKQMNELKINVGLAKKGFLDKKEVLLQYNDTLGKSMGKASSLNEVEARMVKNGGAYIQMTLLKASAQLALQDAAKKAYEAEQAKIKSDDDSLTFWDKTKDVLKRIAVTGAMAQASFGELAKADADLASTAKQRRKESVDDLTKQKDAMLGIANKFQADAAAIAKKTGFDFYNGEMTQKDNSGAGGKKNNDEFTQLARERLEALNETDKLIKDSLARQLKTTYEAYGNETLVENTHYEDELKRLQELFDKKLITKKQFDTVSQQLQSEHHTNIDAIIKKYNQQDRDRTEQAQNELTEIQINGMKEGTAKQIAELQLSQTEKNQQFDKIEADSVEKIKALYAEIEAVKKQNSDTSQLQQQLNTEYNIQQVNCKKREELERQTTDAIDKIKEEHVQNDLIKNDEDAKNAAKSSASKLTAEKQLITDKYNYEITQAHGNTQKIKQLEKEKQDAITKLDTDAAQKRMKQTIDIAKQTASAAFTIISNEIKAQSAAKIAGLERDKSSELTNTSLTSAQRLAIEQKYKQKENQEKVKAFKANQKMQLAQAIINGAIGVQKTISEWGMPLAIPFLVPVVAETAVQIASIASQKPPAFASGGQFISDGRGAVLPGYSRTDNTNAFLRSGEAVVVSEAMRNPWARNLVSSINVAYGGRDFSMANPGKGYAIGGIFTDGGSSNRYYSQPVNDQKDLANTLAYQMINNFPPVYVDVKDVNNQQNILAQTVNRVNL